MNINIYLHGAAEEDVLHRIETKLNSILIKEIEMDKTLEDVLANVAESNTLMESITVLVAGLKDQLAAALTDLSPAQQAKVDQIFAEIDANQEKMIAAVGSNTPAASVSPTEAGTPV